MKNIPSRRANDNLLAMHNFSSGEGAPLLTAKSERTIIPSRPHAHAVEITWLVAFLLEREGVTSWAKKYLRGHLSVSSIFLETVCLARTVYSLILQRERERLCGKGGAAADLPGNYEEDVDGRRQEELLGRHRRSRRRRSRRRRNHFSLLHFKRTSSRSGRINSFPSYTF